MDVWLALDPFRTRPATGRALVALAELFRRPGDAPITAAYVASPGELQLVLASDVPERERLRQYPERRLREFAVRVGLDPSAKASHVVSSPYLSTTRAGLRLLEHVTRRGGELLVLATRSNERLDRLVLGSFAETLVHHSWLPLAVLNPRSQVPASLRRVLYATHLEHRESRAIAWAGRLCRSLDATLVLFHATGGATRRANRGARRTQAAATRRARLRLDRIAGALRRMGTAVETHVDDVVAPTADRILHGLGTARADLVVVTAKRGPVATLLGGSVTRAVVRRADRPVLVVPQALAQLAGGKGKARAAS
jgi:nucleotide-binding universal stress UspA family protein